MYEAYGRNKYVSTGVIQWMLDNAWPSLIWHLYDYYLVPAGGYFGTKKAQEIVHVQYDYTTNSVAVVNGTYEPIENLEVTARLFNIDGKEIDTQNQKLDIPDDAAVKAFDLSKPANLSKTYFLKLYLHDASGKLVSDNFYWLSTKLDTLDWTKRKDTVYTPQKEFADLTGLNALPQIKLEMKSSVQDENGKGIVTVQVKNPSASVAFQVHLRVTKDKDGDDLVPIFWDDNYFSLLPGEEISCQGKQILSRGIWIRRATGTSKCGSPGSAYTLCRSSVSPVFMTRLLCPARFIAPFASFPALPPNIPFAPLAPFAPFASLPSFAPSLRHSCPHFSQSFPLSQSISLACPPRPTRPTRSLSSPDVLARFARSLARSRRLAWNSTLVIAGIFGIAAGAAPNYVGFCSLIACIGFGAGGNLPVDGTMFLEFLPGAAVPPYFPLVWWAVGQVVGLLISWAFLANYGCETREWTRTRIQTDTDTDTGTGSPTPHPMLGVGRRISVPNAQSSVLSA